MTINVALVTSEAVVLGCDSVASVTRLFLDPLAFAERDPEGKLSVDENGKLVARFEFNNLQPVVTDAWGGVTKMFRLCIDKSPVAGVTAGLAKLNNRNVSALAAEFCRQSTANAFPNVNTAVVAFVEFMAGHYEAHYAQTGEPPEFRDDIEFLIGGYGSEENLPSLYRVNLKRRAEDRITPVYGNGREFDALTGVAWAGQSDGVQRLLFGYDGPLKSSIERALVEAIDRTHNSMSQAVARILAETLTALDATLPEGVNTELPPKEVPNLDWDVLRLSIDFANLPLQDAVDLVAYLVNLQSGKSKFVRGVPMVGGRTHVGIVSKDSFTMLNEPELVHRSTGYARDI